MRKVTRENSCVGKKYYSTYGEAEAALKRVRKIHGQHGIELGDSELEPYRCRFCSGFHNGHKPVGKGQTSTQEYRRARTAINLDEGEANAS